MLVYIFLGGLTSAIYNEVLQFFLIVFGFAAAGVSGAARTSAAGRACKAGSAAVATQQGFARRRLDAVLELTWASPQANPMGVEWFGLVMGLGFVLSFGYWCTDFLVVQRAMAADSMSAARRTPLIAAFPKMLFPVPGHPAGHDRDRAAPTRAGGSFALPSNGRHAWTTTWSIPVMLAHYLPDRPAWARADGADGVVHVRHGGQRHRLQHGLDLRHLPELHRARTQADEHYLWMGRVATVVGIAAQHRLRPTWPRKFNNIMDVLQLVFAFVNAPLFATFLLGMFWKRTTGHGAFFGLLAGTAAAAVASRADAAGGRRRRASRAAGSGWCTCTRARWRRISGRPSSPGPWALSSR